MKLPRLMLLTKLGSTKYSTYLKHIENCAKSGISSVQLREKTKNKQFLLEFGRDLQKVLKPFNIPLIINDSLELAAELDAHLWLGQTDACPIMARQILGPDKFIGLTVDTSDQLIIANMLPINCVGISVFKSKTKPDQKTIWGIEGTKALVKMSKHPIIGIGGINIANAPLVLETGIVGIAAIGLFHDSPDPTSDITKLIKIIEEQNVSKITPFSCQNPRNQAFSVKSNQSGNYGYHG